METRTGPHKKLVGRLSLPVESAGMVEMQAEHIIKPDVFRQKYDVMLNMVDFMASLNLVGVKSPAAVRKMNELKLMVESARNGLESQAGNHQPHGYVGAGKVGSHG